ncbi:hypothetical protein HO173_004904 [Letharia columbiana]|uniref:Uncharacterized protein n=1 Tax=Letharia columbiana TaxID=112416 RepID=A0A8H6L688_9LECA|nr:uncharacterized protein HO173_004904 [Letharia columbiana]KAF6237025.1 hypothetical protein HO173_004904 [Letharia columbiana]
MATFAAPQIPAARNVMRYLKKLEERSSNRKQRIGRMSNRINSKNHTIRRLRS